MPVSFTSCPHSMVSGAVVTGGSPTTFPTERYRLSLEVLPPNPFQLLLGNAKEASLAQPFSLST